jgi:uncharacterized protein (TIGR03437 family)
MQTALCNHPSGSADRPTQSTLCFPTGLAVDADGNLYVADRGNGRVLRFPAPFARLGTLPQADLVLGQQSFTTSFRDATPRTMASPYGLAFTTDGGLIVSDAAHNRVLYFPRTDGQFTSGQAATKVFGQPDFVSTAAGNDDSRMNSPRHVSTDTDSRPYVADTANNRVLIFDSISNLQTANARAVAALTQGLSSPRGVYVSPVTGEIWVTDTNDSRSLRYPRFDQLPVSSAFTLAVPAATATLALVQDQHGDLFVADASNRVAIHFPPVAAVNLANSIATRALAPMTLTSVYPFGQRFGTETAQPDFSNLPLPTELADIQVLVNDTAAPLYYVSPGQINMVVPRNAPTSGEAEFQVIRKSTGQILAAGPVRMDVASPGILAGGSGQTRTAAVLNQDNTVNSSTNPAERGSVIQIFATGQGLIDGAPADGDIPRGGLVHTPDFPRVFINHCYLDEDCGGTESHRLFSGLSPGYPGVWQINVRIPDSVPPSSQTGGQTILLFFYKSIPTTDGAFRTVIYVR